MLVFLYVTGIKLITYYIYRIKTKIHTIYRRQRNEITSNDIEGNVAVLTFKYLNRFHNDVCLGTNVCSNVQVWDHNPIFYNNAYTDRFIK